MNIYLNKESKITTLGDRGKEKVRAFICED